MTGKRSPLLISSAVALITLTGICQCDDTPAANTSKLWQKDALTRELFEGDKWRTKLTAPTTADGGPVRVTVKLIVFHTILDEEAGALRTSGLIFAYWRDRRLKWDIDKYYKVPVLHIYNWRVWKPDIMPWNAINRTVLPWDFEAMLRHDGHVSMARPFYTATSCDLDYTHWPWDKQNCKLILGSWTQTGEEVSLQSDYNASITTSPCYFNHFGYHDLLWKTDCAVTLYVFNYPNWGNSTELVANFKMERVTPIDKKIAVSGNIFCAILALATFWIHPGSSVRFIFGTTNLLILFLLMLEFRMSLPMAGAQMPLIMMLTGLQAVLVSLQLLTHLALYNVVSRRDSPPWWLMWPLQGPIGNVIFCFDLPLIGKIQSPAERFIVNEMQGILPTEKEEEEEEEEDGKKSGEKEGANSKDWSLLAQAVDRLTFGCYLVAVGLLFSTYLIGAATSEMPDIKYTSL